MDVVTLFITFFILGTVLGAGLQYYREKEKKKTYKIIEMEIIENLKELKPYVAPDESRRYTKEFDLVEIALTYDIEDIIVVNDEGFVVASTLRDAEDVGAIGLGVYEYIKKFHGNVKKIIIQKDDEYIHIYPLKHHDENVYVIIESKVMLEVLEEKEILMRVHEILEKYFENIDALEKETSKEEAVIA
jgi:hypothetical protein